MTTKRAERTGDLEETMRGFMESGQARMWTALPCLVTAVNLTAQTVSVQPAIKGLTEAQTGEQTAVEMPLLVDVPIVWPRAGGFALTFPVAVGDECLVVFASRCIDGWWQSGGTQEQAELRMHDLSDGFAIFAPTSQPNVLTAVSATNAQLRDEAGTTFLEITPAGKINITAAAEIDLTAPVIKLLAATSITFVTPSMIGGGAGSTGTVNFQSADLQHNGTNVGDDHKHSGVQTGGGNTGNPI